MQETGPAAVAGLLGRARAARARLAAPGATGSDVAQLNAVIQVLTEQTRFAGATRRPFLLRELLKPEHGRDSGPRASLLMQNSQTRQCNVVKLWQGAAIRTELCF